MKQILKEEGIDYFEDGVELEIEEGIINPVDNNHHKV